MDALVSTAYVQERRRMKCPQCKAWAVVLQTRTRKTDGAVTRRYECANLHRFSTLERVVVLKNNVEKRNELD